MTPDSPRSAHGLELLFWPLRLPGRLAADLENLSRAVLALSRTADRHLPSIDGRAAELLDVVETMSATVARLEEKVDELTGLESTIEDRMQGLQDDLNTRMLAVEAEVHGMRPAIDTVAREVQSVVRLLPDPSDGPFARLRDTLTSS